MRKKSRLALVVVSCLILGAVVGHIASLPPKETSTRDQANGESASVDSSSKDGSSTTRPATELSSPQRDPAAANSPGNDSRDKPSAAGKVSLTLLFVSNVNGFSIAGVEVVAETYARPEIGASRRDLGRHRTGLDGAVHLVGDAGDKGFLSIESREWRLPNDRDGVRLEWRDSGSEIVVRLEHVEAISLTVRYADGVPYTGQVEYWSPSRKVDQRLVNDGKAELSRIDKAAMTIDVPSRRPGFASKRLAVDEGVPRDEMGLNSILVELPTVDDGKGSIEIDLGLFSRNEVMMLAFGGGPEDGRAESWSEQGAFGGTHYHTKVLEPGEYRAFVRAPGANSRASDGLVWRSDVIAVEANSTTRVQAVPQRTSSVTATIMSDIGKPLFPARLGHAGGSYVNWDWATSPASGSDGPRTQAQDGMTDRMGRAALAGLVPGVLTLALEAPGFEIMLREVTLQPGEVHDLGVVRLTPAVGVIEVVVSNPVDGAEYEVFLLEPMGVPIRRPQKFKEASFRFQGLASSRRYTVALGRVGGGVTTKSQNVTLTQEKPHARLEFTFRPLSEPG